MSASHIYQGWDDTTRREQLRRTKAIAWTKFNFALAAQARAAVMSLPTEVGEGSDVPMRPMRVPSAYSFGGVLAFLCVTNEFGMTELELSVQDIATRIGRCTKTVERVLECLRAIRWLERPRRLGWGAINRVWQRMYRTSITVLTALGRAALGIGQKSNQTQPKRPRLNSPRPPAPKVPKSQKTSAKSNVIEATPA
jgi:hypothetical protein